MDADMQSESGGFSSTESKDEKSSNNDSTLFEEPVLAGNCHEPQDQT
jgi:hypothetical protein